MFQSVKAQNQIDDLQRKNSEKDEQIDQASKIIEVLSKDVNKRGNDVCYPSRFIWPHPIILFFFQYFLHLTKKKCCVFQLENATTELERLDSAITTLKQENRMLRAHCLKNSESDANSEGFKTPQSYKHPEKPQEPNP